MSRETMYREMYATSVEWIAWFLEKYDLAEDVTPPVWSAPNDLWNEVMGGPDGIVCPSCFASEAGPGIVWRFAPRPASPDMGTERSRYDRALADFAKALTEYGVHHGNCSLDSWNKDLTRCKCGLFALVKEAERALAAAGDAPEKPDGHAAELLCGQCGDWLRPEDIEGHLNSEGRTQ